MKRSVVGVVAVAAGIWLSPVPEGLTAPAWHLFALFAATVVAVVIDAVPILTASVLAVALAVISGTLSPEQAYAGFANGTILLIVVAFLVARAVITCGLGRRSAMPSSACSGGRRSGCPTACSWSMA
jgi:divalent anion:Na+ symporter, DASS family